MVPCLRKQFAVFLILDLSSSQEVPHKLNIPIFSFANHGENLESANVAVQRRNRRGAAFAPFAKGVPRQLCPFGTLC